MAEVTAADVARRIDVPPDTLRRWVRSGLVPLADDGTWTDAAIAQARIVARLRELGVTPLAVGRSIVATWEPMEAAVLEVIRELGLELQITFNKGAVMVLPPGVNKASGLEAALQPHDQLSQLNVAYKRRQCWGLHRSNCRMRHLEMLWLERKVER